MKHFTFILLGIIVFFPFSQNFSQPFQNYIGGVGNDYIEHMVQTNDGNFIATGSKNIKGINKIWLLKLTANAKVLWEHIYDQLDTTVNDYGHRILILPDESLLICGERQAREYPAMNSALLIKVDSLGNKIWGKTYLNTSAAFDAINSNDKLLIVGRGVSSDSNGLVMLLDVNGNEIWKKKWSVRRITIVRRIFPTSDGNFIIVGRTAIVGEGTHGIFLQKIDINGSEFWNIIEHTDWDEAEYFNEYYYPQPLGATQLKDGTIIVANPEAYNSDIAIMNFSSNGKLLSKKIYGNQLIREVPIGLSLNKDSTINVFGWIEDLNNGPKKINAFALNINRDGIINWNHIYNNNNAQERVYQCNELIDNTLLFNGSSSDTLKSNGGVDGWILHSESNGNIFPNLVICNAYYDINNNCNFDSDIDKPAKNWIIKSNNPNDHVLATNIDGQVKFRTSNGIRTFSLINQDTLNWEICQNDQVIVSDSNNNIVSINYLIGIKDGICSLPEVNITQPDLVLCDTITYYVSIRNKFFNSFDSSKLIINLDSEFTPLNANLPFLQIGSDIEFKIPKLEGLSEQVIQLKLKLNCEIPIGSSHGIRATLYPTICPSSWTGPVYSVNGNCNGQNIQFIMKNTGAGGQSIKTKFRVTKNYLLDSDWTDIDLPENNSTQILNIPADGKTWRIEIKQNPNYPGEKVSSAVVEGCGKGMNGLADIGYHSIWPYEDGGKLYASAYSPVTTGAPNKISESLKGLGSYKFTESFTPLEFTIRMKNIFDTTVHSVRFDLSLLKTLDLSTFRPLASNCAFDFQFSDNGTIILLMNNCNLLPNESAYLKFRIDPDYSFLTSHSYSSLMSIHGVGFLDNYGPILLIPGFNNVNNSLPVEDDEYVNYPSNCYLFGGREITYGEFAENNNDGTIFLGGGTYSFSDRTYEDGYLLKSNSDGVAFWQNAFDNGLHTTNFFVDIETLPDSGAILLGGSTKDEVDNNWELSDNWMILMRIDNQGKKIWQKFYRPGGEDFGCAGRKIQKTKDGNYVIVGYALNDASPVSLGIDQFYMAIDTSGQVLWSNVVKLDKSAYLPSNFVNTPDGGFLVFGYNLYNTLFSLHTPFVLEKISSTGSIEWHKELITSNEFSFYDVILSPDNNVLLVGSARWLTPEKKNVTTPAFVKINMKGDLIFEKYPIVGVRGDAVATCIYPGSDGGFYVGGVIIPDTIRNDNDVLLLKIDDNAEVQWYKNYGNINFEFVNDILVSKTNKVILYGYNYERPPAYELKSLLVHTELDGSVSNVPEIKDSFEKITIFPNPTSVESIIMLAQEPSKSFQWYLYNLGGKLIQSGINAEWSFKINVENLPSGVYYIKFSEPHLPVQKILVVH